MRSGPRIRSALPQLPLLGSCFKNKSKGPGWHLNASLTHPIHEMSSTIPADIARYLRAAGFVGKMSVT